MRFAISFAFLLSTTTFACANTFSYAIVVSSDTKEKSDWSEVVSVLEKKYPKATTIVWNTSPKEVLEALSDIHPQYSCFVARPDEVTREFVASVHRLTRDLDSDPYCDTLWGILTGYDAANALRIASNEQPLTIDRVAAGTEIALSQCKEGVWYDELEQYKQVEKKVGAAITQLEGPADTTLALANTLRDDYTDLFVTSGHATERNWQIGFRYKNGYFQSESGKMFGRPTSGNRFRIQSTNPKVYLAVGNCLMGHIDGPDAMALAWMNDINVHQMVGYTVLTWYGYGGWGVLDYFIEQPGRYSLAQAFHANQHALIHRIDTCFPELTGRLISPGSRSLPSAKPNELGLNLGLTDFDSQGLLWDRDTVAFYGDPAWKSVMADLPKAYEQSLTMENGIHTLTITPMKGIESFNPININGSQRGGRPIIEFIPQRIEKATIIEGEIFEPVITDDFILVPNHAAKNHGKELVIRFRADFRK